MSEQPFVSVIIATYNRARLLPETIESVLSQRFKEFELIVVDDGSTDDTQELLERYRAQVRYVRQNNRGPSAARNLGVRHSRAPWISIQDSDDLCAPHHLEVLVEYVSAHPQVGLVFANGQYLGGPEHGRQVIIPERKSRRLAARGVRLKDIFEKSIVRLQSSLISRSAYDAAGGHDESLRICMDLDLSLRLSMRVPVAYVDETVFFYRKHEGNIGKDQDRRLTENIQVIEKLLRDYPEAGNLLGQTSVARRLAYRYYRLAKSRWQCGLYNEARRSILEALRLRPYALKYWFYQVQWRFQKGLN